MPIKAVKRQRGLSLIESMIALLVLSIGLVGLGALMLISLQNVHSSAHYSVASAVVLDLEELLWLNVARTAVSGPGNFDADGCISDNAIDALAAAVANEWNTASVGGDSPWSDAERFKMPGISLDTGVTDVSCVEDSGVCMDRNGDGVADVSWKMVPVTLSWDEGRFTDGAGGESYTATITLVCRPTFL